MLSFAARLRRLRLAEAPDVVVGSSPHLLAAAGAAGLAKRAGAAFVLELRDIWPQSLIDLGSYSPAHPAMRAMRFIERRLYRDARVVVALMPRAAEHVATAGGDPGRVRWVPNAADPDAVPPGPPREGKPFTLLYAGAHGLANDLGTLLEAAALLQAGGAAVRVRLVGDGPLKAALQGQAEARALRNVEFRPAVARKELAAELHDADAFVLPLKDAPVFRHGISPNKLFDYLLAARPVIAAVPGGAPPVLDSGAGLAVPPGDPASLAEAVRRLAGLPAAERRRMGELGRRLVLESYSAASVADRFEAALREALAAR